MKKQGREVRIRYDEGCLAAHALNFAGDRWALLLVRELMFAAKRFQKIRSGLPGITASVLTGRLAQLQEAGVADYDAKAGTYSLTVIGRGLLPVLESLCRWALTVPSHDPSRFISPSALMISMGVTLQRERAAGCDQLAGFDFGSEVFEAHVHGGQLHVRSVVQAQAPFVLAGSGNALAAAVYGKMSLQGLMRSKTVNAIGDVGLAQAFVGLFELKVPE